MTSTTPILIGLLFVSASVTATNAESQNPSHILGDTKIIETHRIDNYHVPMTPENVIDDFKNRSHAKQIVFTDGRGLIIPKQLEY